jgi:hypothetical protein
MILNFPNENEIDNCFERLNMIIISTVGRAGSGCGESSFSKYIQASVIEINSEKKWVKILS